MEAYWIGNGLLENVEKKKFYRHLLEDQGIKKKIGAKPFESVAGKIISGAAPHHSFHVLNIWRRTGHLDREHTLDSMEQCRISWGRVINVEGPFINVSSEPLILSDGKLKLGAVVRRRVIRNLESFGDIAEVAPENLVSIHWGIPCEIITPRHAAYLKKYTLRSIEFANRDL